MIIFMYRPLGLGYDEGQWEKSLRKKRVMFEVSIFLLVRSLHVFRQMEEVLLWHNRLETSWVQSGHDAGVLISFFQVQDANIMELPISLFQVMLQVWLLLVFVEAAVTTWTAAQET